MTNLRHKNQRVAVFIDAQNMYHSARSLFGGRVNFKAVLQTAVGGRQLIRAFSYVIRTKTGEEKAFLDALLKAGIELRVKDLQEFYGGAKKGDWDVGLTVDAVRTAEIVDTIVIASGDGDFIPLVEYLKNQGRRVEIMAFGKSTSGKLKEVADDFVDLGEEPAKYILKK